MAKQNNNGKARYMPSANKIASPSKAAANPKLPEGFSLLSTIPEEVGGGSLCLAPVARLAEMVPNWNPNGRTSPEDRASDIRKLVKSIKGHGLGQFPVVNDTEVVEGNRRVKAAHLLELRSIPVLYPPGPTPSPTPR